MDEAIIEKIKKINWFSNCGKPFNFNSNYSIYFITNANKAAKLCQGRYWEDITHEADNQLSQYLHDNFREKYRNWNTYTKDGREVINKYVKPNVIQFLELNRLPSEVSYSIFGDILSAIVEFMYRNEKAPGFFTELLKVYEAGNFPCGWKGSWPEGKLIVY